MAVKIVGLRNLRRGIRGLDDDFTPSKREVRVLFGALGRAVRDDTRRQITTQGKGSWPKLGKWARARTGRRKALVTERKHIKFKIGPRQVEIGYQPHSGFNLTQHHRGFTTPGFSGKKIFIPLKNPKPLKVSGDGIFINNAQASVVPARKVWGTLTGHLRTTKLITRKWMRRVIKKRVR